MPPDVPYRCRSPSQSKSDEQALDILSRAYPGRKVVGVYSRDVLLNAGNVHW